MKINNKISSFICIVLLSSCTTTGENNKQIVSGKDGDKGGFFIKNIKMGEIPNWYSDDFKETVAPFTRSCQTFLRMDDNKNLSTKHIELNAGEMKVICNKWREGKYNKRSSTSIRKFFEDNFDAKKVYSKGEKTGIFTGYFEPYIEGTKLPTCETLTPVYGLPFNKKDRNYTRADIENGAISEKAPIVYWVNDPAEFFVMQIQGGGVVLDKERGQTRLAYAGNNGYNFKSISKIMQDDGVVLTNWSMQNVKDFLVNNPVRARRLMAQNPRYIYYKEIVSSGPIGSLGVPLTAQRSIAVDNSVYPLGLPVWINFKDANKKSIEKLTFAQDTGIAIKGNIRADYFWGTGNKAFAQAGKTHAMGEFVVLLPKK